MSIFLATTPGQGLVIPLLILMVMVGAIGLSLLGRWFLPQVPGWKVCLFSPVVSAALLFGYYWVRMLLQDASQAPAAAAYREASARISEGLTLNAWGIELDPTHPTLHVEYTVRVDATVAVSVIAGSPPAEPGTYPRWHYLAQSDLRLTQRTLRSGETCKLDVPLVRNSPGIPEAFVITFEIDSTDSSGAHATTIYATFPLVHQGLPSLPLPPAQSR